MKMAFLIAPQVKHVPPALTWSGLFTLTALERLLLPGTCD